MLQFAAQGNYLIRAVRDGSTLVSIDVVDIESGSAYSLREPEPASADVLTALLAPDASQRLDASASAAGVTFKYTRVLPSGLELRPQLLEVPAAREPLSLVSMVSELCRENASLRADVARVSQESELRSKCLEDMVLEKEHYQDTMLRRVSAIIDDRNARVAAAAATAAANVNIKDEPE